MRPKKGVKEETRERGETETSQVKHVVQKEWDARGISEGTGQIFITGVDHRGVLTRGFQGSVTHCW